MSDEAAAKLTLSEEAGDRILEGPARACRASLIVEACFSHRAKCALLYASNLTGKFFDLSSGEAVAILQKLRTYRIRLTVVCGPDVRFSSMFGEMPAEESRRDYFRVFESPGAAREWLSGIRGPDASPLT